MVRIAGILILCFSIFGAANAQALKTKQIEALSNVHMEYSVCIAYYLKFISCSPKEMEAEATQQLTPTIRNFFNMSTKIAATIKMTDDAAVSRIKMADEEQTRVIKNSCTNFSSLYPLHGQRCKLLGENSDAIYNEYLNK
jgi:hypothetical protein